MKKPRIILISLIILIIVVAFALRLISEQKEDLDNETDNAVFVIDGDTFQTNEGETIRLLCVDTPEENNAGYEEATAYLSTLILGKDIEIERQGIDKYNRTLAWIYQEDVLINKEIVDNGFGELFIYEGTDCERMK